MNEREIETRIWSESLTSQSDTTIRESVLYLAKKLGEYLGREVDVREINIDAGDSGSCSVYAKRNRCSPLTIDWYCTIVVRLPEDFEEQRTQVFATLLAFIDGKRIGLQGHAGQSVLHLQYRPGDTQSGEWEISQWSKDDYGEWESSETPPWS
ncbi:hypothetical protein ACYFX5_05365 [Bremerella sp. T1]|uniref:hypothetical protein n=1 Tax=Bremerella sp. TYQ1 TaxID=3119568 RepID=UPI001CCB9FEF|nr:hypothetical protein [Bremerella volcania]UBM37686.1 hypothetical protein LA756_07305 [Bremerella volcania]